MDPITPATSHWLGYSHMTTFYCKEDWEMWSSLVPRRRRNVTDVMKERNKVGERE